MSELKPCPFCGGEASIAVLYGLFAVGCNSGSNCPGNIEKCAPMYFEKETAKEYWNKRAGDGEQE